jgi:glycosyltransferase involved in cell wall biosynthesis
MAVGPLAGVPTVLDGDDFEYVREAALLHSTPWYGAKAWNYLNVAKLWWWERSWARRHTLVVRCSAEDRDRHPAANIAIVPNGARIPEQCPRDPQPRLLFVGLMSYPPNHHAMEWFLTDVWPLIRAQVPDAACDIIGKDPEPLIACHHGAKGVEVHGFVRDLAPFYRRAAASIAPLRAGSGTRLKILESLSYAVPVVSTTLGALGLDAGEAQGLHRADTAAAFADLCRAQLQSSPAEQTTSAGRDYVIREFDWTAIHQRVAKLARQAAETRVAGELVA